jgi:hypothetical protein
MFASISFEALKTYGEDMMEAVAASVDNRVTGVRLFNMCSQHLYLVACGQRTTPAPRLLLPILAVLWRRDTVLVDEHISPPQLTLYSGTQRTSLEMKDGQVYTKSPIFVLSQARTSDEQVGHVMPLYSMSGGKNGTGLYRDCLVMEVDECSLSLHAIDWSEQSVAPVIGVARTLAQDACPLLERFEDMDKKCIVPQDTDADMPASRIRTPSKRMQASLDQQVQVRVALGGEDETETADDGSSGEEDQEAVPDSGTPPTQGKTAGSTEGNGKKNTKYNASRRSPAAFLNRMEGLSVDAPRVFLETCAPILDQLCEDKGLRAALARLPRRRAPRCAADVDDESYAAQPLM